MMKKDKPGCKVNAGMQRRVDAEKPAFIMAIRVILVQTKEGQLRCARQLKTG